MNKHLKFILIINILVLDLVFLYLFLNGKFDSASSYESGQNSTDTNSGQLPDDNCGEECQNYIAQAIKNIQVPVSATIIPTRTIANSQGSVTKAKVRSVSYIPIPGSGSTTNTDWTTLPGTDFYLSKNDYPGLIGIYFETNIKLFNGNGTAYFRVYDITHNIGVQGSEVSTNSQTSTFVGSGILYPWEGNNHYAVQAKSLTADSAVFESGRLKIITEN